MSPREIITGDSSDLVAALVGKLGKGGAKTFALVWTHPEYPVTVDEEPPAGVPVTWTAAATFPIKVRGLRGVDHLRTASVRSDKHELAVVLALANLIRELGGRVTLEGYPLDDLEAVPTPPEAYVAAGMIHGPIA